MTWRGLNSLALVQHIRAPFFIGLPVSELDGLEPMTLVKPPRAVILLKCVKAYGKGERFERVAHQHGSDSLMQTAWLQVHLIYP